MTGEKQTWTFDLATVEVAVGYDEDGQPTLVIADGDNEVKFIGVDDPDTLAGIRRITEKIWTFQQAVKTQSFRSPE